MNTEQFKELKTVVEVYFSQLPQKIGYIPFDSITFESLIKRNNPLEFLYEFIDEQTTKRFTTHKGAINYLKNKDCTLKSSIKVAKSLGYSLENINTKLLATLLYNEIVTTNFEDYRKEIEDFLKLLTSILNLKESDTNYIKVFNSLLKDMKYYIG